MKKRKWLSLLLAVMMLVSAVPFFPVTADAADGTVEVSTWAELKKALDYTTNCSVVKVVKDIETKSLNGHTGLHQDNIIFMSMAIPKTPNAPPPIVTAISTSSPGRPTDFPTTFG